MPDQILTSPEPTGQKPTAEELAALQHRIEELAEAAPGVAALNPTLLASLRRLELPGESAVDLVWRAGSADVDLALTTHSTHQARATGRQIQDDVRTAVTAAGLTPGTIQVHVVTIQHPGEEAAEAQAEVLTGS